MRRDVFQAIADPNRRDILMLLARKPANVNTITSHFDITRTAVTKHMRILEQCGLISITQRGREKQCKANTQKLKLVLQWIKQLESLTIKLKSYGNRKSLS